MCQQAMSAVEWQLSVSMKNWITGSSASHNIARVIEEYINVIGSSNKVLKINLIVVAMHVAKLPFVARSHDEFYIFCWYYYA